MVALKDGVGVGEGGGSTVDFSHHTLLQEGRVGSGANGFNYANKLVAKGVIKARNISCSRYVRWRR
jgi:hypothetical protein